MFFPVSSPTVRVRVPIMPHSHDDSSSLPPRPPPPSPVVQECEGLLFGSSPQAFVVHPSNIVILQSASFSSLGCPPFQFLLISPIAPCPSKRGSRSGRDLAHSPVSTRSILPWLGLDTALRIGCTIERNYFVHIYIYYVGRLVMLFSQNSRTTH